MTKITSAFGHVSHSYKKVIRHYCMHSVKPPKVKC